MKVLRISLKDTLPIRKKMLREDYSSEECTYDDDDSDSSFHLGSFTNSKLVSVASFFFEKHPDLNFDNQYQLRGMATLPDFQSKGVAKSLLELAYPIIKQNFCNILWCNARSNSLDFYIKCGFSPVGKPFEVKDIGEHQLMVKEIS